jgi:hypothetical protein
MCPRLAKALTFIAILIVAMHANRLTCAAQEISASGSVEERILADTTLFQKEFWDDFTKFRQLYMNSGLPHWRVWTVVPESRQLRLADVEARYGQAYVVEEQAPAMKTGTVSDKFLSGDDVQPGRTAFSGVILSNPRIPKLTIKVSYYGGIGFAVNAKDTKRTVILLIGRKP